MLNEVETLILLSFEKIFKAKIFSALLKKNFSIILGLIKKSWNENFRTILNIFGFSKKRSFLEVFLYFFDDEFSSLVNL